MGPISPYPDGGLEHADARGGTIPLVSVVIPTYNRHRVLVRAIRSVLDQDFTDFELLVIDDGSTDGTARVVADLTDPRIRYWRLGTNQGVGPARCEGVSRSRGAFVAFLDHDDSWKPGKLATAVAAFERYPDIDIVFSNFDNINHVENIRESGFVTVAPAMRLLRTSPLSGDWWAIEAGVPEALMRLNFIGTCSVVVIRRSVFQRAGNFRGDLSGPEDLEMWWRAALLGLRFAYTTEVLAERHKDLGSMTSQKAVFATRVLKVLDACEETARRAGRLDLLSHVALAKKRTWCDLAEACASEGRLRGAWKAFRSGQPSSGPLHVARHLAMAVVEPWIAPLVRHLYRT